MAMSSLAAASRNLSLALRTRVPRNVAHLHRGRQQQMADKGAFAEALRNFRDPATTEAIKQKISNVAKPISDRKEIPLLMFSVSVLGYYAWSERNKKDQKNMDNVPTPMLRETAFFTPSLVNNETMPMRSKAEDESGPCEPCAMDADDIVDSVPTPDVEDCQPSGIKPMATAYPCVAVNGGAKDDSSSGIGIPEIVSHTTIEENTSSDADSSEPSEASEYVPSSGKKRRRKSRAAMKENAEE